MVTWFISCFSDRKSSHCCILLIRYRLGGSAFYNKKDWEWYLDPGKYSLITGHIRHYYAVQAFNSCTSRPDLCQWLVVQTPIDNVKKIGQEHDPCSLRIKAMFSVIHAWPEYWVTIGRVVVYHTLAAQSILQSELRPALKGKCTIGITCAKCVVPYGMC